MSNKVYDGKGRWRNKIVSFRVSEEEWEEISRLVKISGMSKQAYVMDRLANREITVLPNPRIHRALKAELQSTVERLQDSDAGEEVCDIIALITSTIAKM